MVELADIFRLHGPPYRAHFGERMPPSHLRAMHDMAQCRTESLGGQLYYCTACQDHPYSYHSCTNRHCPKCQNDHAEQWLANHKSLLLPVPHFLVTCILPEELRALARAHQKTIYNILFRASSAALQDLALDPRFIGGRDSMVGVLHTWTRALLYHPHVHSIVTGGGRSADGHWLPARRNFLVHVAPLSILFRAKGRDALTKIGMCALVDAWVWHKDWVVHCEPVGSGVAALRSLAPYIFHVAISHNRILQLEDGHITFQYKASATKQVTTCQVRAEECIRRFLQYVLPNRFVKGRYDGLRSPANRSLLHRAQAQLGTKRIAILPRGKAPQVTAPVEARAAPRCPTCGRPLILVETLRPQGRSPPCI